jgi:hypothetical protein
MTNQLILRPQKVFQFALEIFLILYLGWFFTQHLQDFSPNRRLTGAEFSYLISSGEIAHVVYQKTGAIPLWNPFIGLGEPLLENPFSYVLNPLMTWPILWWGAYNGAKIAVLLHIGLMGIGGWLLAYTLRLNAPSRLLLALILAGSGSIAANIGNGFYQMGLSQAYIPWVLAGVTGTLYLEKRWPIVVLAASTTLMIFAGTFWHILPTALGAGLLTLAALARWDSEKRRPTIQWRRLRRILIAGIFIVGLAAIRLIPQFRNQDLVAHPAELLRDAFGFSDILMRHFTNVVPTGSKLGNVIMHYHYILPGAFVLALLLLRLGVILFRRLLPIKTPLRPRMPVLLVPCLLIILVLTVWAMEDVPIVHAVYDALPVLYQWRYVGRMGATASVFIAIVAALWLDDLVLVLQEVTGGEGASVFNRLVKRLVLCLLLITSVSVGLDVMNNWRLRAGLETDADPQLIALGALREQHPTEFLSVFTPDFFRYFPMYRFLIRAANGNPDYRPLGRAATLGTDGLFYRASPTYALAYGDPVIDFWKTLGYKALDTIPRFMGQDVMYYNDSVPTYAFTVTKGRLTGKNRSKPLTFYDTLPITNFEHNIDSVRVRVNNWPLDSVLFVQETSYPGWEATINGTPVIVESVGERIGVQLPNDVERAEVVFHYRPPLLLLSAAVSGVFFVLFTAYALQWDRRWRRVRRLAVAH